MAGKLLLIHDEASAAMEAIVAGLEEKGISTAQFKTSEEGLEREAESADAVLLIAGDFLFSTPQILDRLKELCVRKSMLLWLLGYREEIAAIEVAVPEGLVQHEVLRPGEAPAFVEKLAPLVAANEARKRQKSVLLVDDDVTFLQMMQKWLSTEYRVSAVRSGKQAMSFVSSRRPDLILLDYEMPETTGPEVLKMLRDSPAADIPVFFLTGKCDEKSAENAALLEPDGYLLKAAGKERVLAAVEEFFASHA